MDINTKISKLEAYAEARYNKGYDTFIECYEHDDWVKFLTKDDGKIMPLKYALKIMSSIASIYRERQAGAKYYRENW